ncbi:MAG: guanylate kinase [Olegusella sp.]|nr:guanylate kinase [Olegusella sp.]
MSATPRLFVISGPAGVGKGTLVARVRELRPDLDETVSATTRSPRPGEVEGVSYHYLSDEEFARRVAAGDFLEHAEVHGHSYGTLRSEVESRIARGRSVILEIDYQGAFQVREAFPAAVLVFIEPPSFEELERRLRGRGTEDEEHIELRLHNARHEIEIGEQYDVRIVNDEVERASRELLDVMAQYETDGGSGICQ